MHQQELTAIHLMLAYTNGVYTMIHVCRTYHSVNTALDISFCLNQLIF